uniref:Uncharacterized protein n=1 Tax=Anguilla anguilla TaxID=7936 RepID=A0A0E9QE72_ANGAN
MLILVLTTAISCYLCLEGLFKAHYFKKCQEE